jgi:hypothetical protein
MSVGAEGMSVGAEEMSIGAGPKTVGADRKTPGADTWSVGRDRENVGADAFRDGTGVPGSGRDASSVDVDRRRAATVKLGTPPSMFLRPQATLEASGSTNFQSTPTLRVSPPTLRASPPMVFGSTPMHGASAPKSATPASMLQASAKRDPMRRSPFRPAARKGVRSSDLTPCGERRFVRPPARGSGLQT